MFRNREPKEAAMKLQFIHEKSSLPGASSLYCQWISTRQGKGGRLAAIWMDQEMRAFEGEFAREAGTDEQAASVGEVSGDRPLCGWQSGAGEIQNGEVRWT
jgi:hypothetical protein